MTINNTSFRDAFARVEKLARNIFNVRETTVYALFIEILCNILSSIQKAAITFVETKDKEAE